MVAKLQIFKLRMQLQAVPVSDIYLSKVTYQNIFVSSDLGPDLDTFQGIYWAFSKTLHERNQTMYNYMVAKLQNFKLQMQNMVNKLHERNLLHLKKLHDRNQTMYNCMFAPLQNFKLQMQSQAVPASDLSLSKVTYQNIFVSSDLAPDLDPFQGINRAFSKPYNIDPKISHFQTKKRFVTPLSCDLEPDITKPTFSKTKIIHSTS